MNNILSDLAELLDYLQITFETGVYSDEIPEGVDAFAVIVPGTSDFTEYSDNFPGFDIQRASIQVAVKKNYADLQARIAAALLWKGFYVQERVYEGYNDTSGCHAFTINVERVYDMEPYTDLIRKFMEG